MRELLQNLNKQQILIGLGVGLVLIASLAGIFSGGNNLTGNVGGTPDETDTDQQEITCEVPDELNDLVESLNVTSQAINEINLDEEESMTILEEFASGVFSILNSISDEGCIENIQTVNAGDLEWDSEQELVKITNEAIDEINNECTNCEIDELEALDIEFSCNADRTYNEEDGECVDEEPEATACSALELYNAVTAVNALLDRYKNNAEGFGDSQIDELEELMRAVNPAENFGNFNYENQAEPLSSQLVALVDGIRNLNEENCQLLTGIEPVLLAANANALETPDAGASQGNTNNANSNNLSNDDLEGILNGAISCPANSILDGATQECFCPATDTYLRDGQTCGQSEGNSNSESSASSDSDEEIVNPVASEEERISYCADGTPTFDLTECEEIQNSMTNDPETNDANEIVNDFPEQPDMDEDSDESENSEDFANEFNNQEAPVVDSNSGEPSVQSGGESSGESENSNLGTLNSNTNANVMGAGIVQGDTGPGLWLAILVSILGTLGYRFLEKQK